ncbi:MAG: S1 RNA-binding domain-containing protein [Planctomycetota bacterium]|nr:S1 RNA-binding domain-containing protein [Planctomycetota bacterium]
MSQIPSSAAAPETPSEPTSAAQTAGSMSADLAAEIDRAMDQSLAAATHHPKPSAQELDQAHKAMGDRPRIKGPRVVEGGREKRPGVVVSVGPTDIFIEFGPKQLGVLPRIQFKEGQEPPKVGETVEVVVDRFETSENLYVCSLPGAVQKADWELLEPGQIVEARVTGVNKGGLELEVAKHQAFMPASQVDTRRIEDLSVFVGEKLTCKVVRVDRTGRGNITLSRRDIVAQEREAETQKLRESIKEGDVREGVVKKIMPFGAFVDIGGFDGLLHVSDLSHDRVKNVSDVVKEGDKVTVKVLKLDWEHKRHSLGMKQLSEDPWAAAIKDVVEGAVLSGKVTKLAEFGCFVEVAAGAEGLVHISELAWQRVDRVSDVVQPNKVVKVKVLKVDPGTKKISLSIKQTTEAPQREGAPRGGRRGGREEDNRKAEEILKETPQLRRLREAAKAKHGKDLKSGLGSGNLGMGLGDLRL